MDRKKPKMNPDTLLTDERGAGNVPQWKGIGLIDEKMAQAE